MKKTAAKAPETRTETLERLIPTYQASYYNGEAEISDGEFDLLWDELQRLKPDSPVLARVGADNTDGFPKARHLIPMGSQEKAANPEDFRAWAAKIAPETFVVQYKLDGASLELQYEGGKLIRAITRGDGIIGDEITRNARRMIGVVPELDIPFTGGIRGEVVMTHQVWQEKYPDKANCRNAANGIMRRKDGAGCEDLTLITYDAAATGEDRYFQDEIEKIAWLQNRGFSTTETTTFTDVAAIIAYREGVAEKRASLSIDIDGLVVKDRVTDMTDLRRTRPERQIAFKFDPEVAYSILRTVEWSESGATYTPIGVVDPVRLAGTTVQRANLNNPGMIRALGLKIGSVVSVVKRGEIIPKIEGLAPEGVLPSVDTAVKNRRVARRRQTFVGKNRRVARRGQTPVVKIRMPGVKNPRVARRGQTLAVKIRMRKMKIRMPRTCGSCGASLEDGGTRLYCPNPKCPKRLLHRLEKWVAVLDIRELGEKLLRQLYDKERVRRIPELYTLEPEELAEFERMGKLSAAKVVRHIRTKRELSLAAFVAGFDFEGVGETIMEKVVSAGFNTLETLRAASIEDLAGVYGLGEITARTIMEGLKETVEEMDAVLATRVITIAPPPPDEAQPLRGLSFCFTGELSAMKRNEAEEKVKALGASAKSSVVKDLSFLVTNDPESGSSKNKKAQSLGIPIIGEEDFRAILDDPTKAVNWAAVKAEEGKAQASEKKSALAQGELF